MSEYVELGEIISVLKQRYDRLSGLRPDFYAGYMAAVKIIEQETRTADVAPVVHGRWLTWEEQFPGEIPKKKADLECSAPLATTMLTICLTSAPTVARRWTERKIPIIRKERRNERVETMSVLRWRN